MFGNWNNARVKAADRALQDGRLDEAVDRLIAIQDRKGHSLETVLDDAARALAARARLQAQAGRPQDALADLNKLQQLGKLDAESAALAQRLGADMRVQAADQNQAAEAAAVARQRLGAGALDSVREALNGVGDPVLRKPLEQELTTRQRRIQERLEQARAAFAKCDIAVALRHWNEALQIGRTRECDDLAHQLGTSVLQALEEAFRAGKLDRWSGLAAQARPLAAFVPQVRERLALASQIEAAGKRLGANDFAALKPDLLRLKAAGGARWIEDALKALDQIEDLRAALLAGPLGLAFIGNSTLTPQNARGVAATDPLRGDADHASAPARDPLLMLVDGAASVLLVFNDVTRIGRLGGGAAVEVPIPGDLLSHHADIVRAGEDYFLVAHGPATVNAAPVARVLLRDGDRIRLGGNTQFVFRAVSQRSESAALLLSSRARLEQDVSQVILFKTTCLIGPQSHCHLQVRDTRERLVLFERQGRLFLRNAAETGLAINPVAALPLDATTQFGELRLTVKRFRSGSGLA